jgi:CheY-like chemotaxis protein
MFISVESTPATGIQIPAYGEFSARTRELLEEALRWGGMFIAGANALPAGKSLVLQLVQEDGGSLCELPAWVTKVRRKEPRDETFVCFARLGEARKALQLVSQMVSTDNTVALSALDRTTEENPIGPATVLVVHPDAQTREQLARDLESSGFEVQTAQDGHDALQAIRSWDPQAVLTWARTAGVPGSELPSRLKESGSNAVVVVLVAPSDEEASELAKTNGANFVIPYPDQAAEIPPSILAAIELNRV